MEKNSSFEQTILNTPFKVGTVFYCCYQIKVYNKFSKIKKPRRFRRMLRKAKK